MADVKQSFKNLGTWVKKHPVIAGLILLAVVVLAYIAYRRSQTSGSSTTVTEPTGSTTAPGGATDVYTSPATPPGSGDTTITPPTITPPTIPPGNTNKVIPRPPGGHPGPNVQPAPGPSNEGTINAQPVPYENQYNGNYNFINQPLPSGTPSASINANVLPPGQNNNFALPNVPPVDIGMMHGPGNAARTVYDPRYNLETGQPIMRNPTGVSGSTPSALHQAVTAPATPPPGPDIGYMHGPGNAARTVTSYSQRVPSSNKNGPTSAKPNPTITQTTGGVLNSYPQPGPDIGYMHGPGNAARTVTSYSQRVPSSPSKPASTTKSTAQVAAKPAPSSAPVRVPHGVTQKDY